MTNTAEFHEGMAVHSPETEPAQKTTRQTKLGRIRKPLTIAVGSITAIGVAWAAAFTSTSGVSQDVGITAWVTAAVVGSAATIAAARHS